MIVEALIPYLLVIALPVLLWAMFAAFRWRYLLRVRNTIYSPLAPETPVSSARAEAHDVPPLSINWIDPLLEAKPMPARLVEAQTEGRRMRAALVVAGLAFMVVLTLVEWYGLNASGIAGRTALALGYVSTLPGLFLIVVFAGRGWKSWLTAIVLWLAVAVLIFLGPVHVRPARLPAAMISCLNWASMPFVGVALLAPRAFRPLLVGFVPMVLIWFASAAAMAATLSVLGVNLEFAGTTARAYALGFATAIVGMGITARQIRKGISGRFVLLLAGLAAIGLIGGATESRHLVLAAIGGVGFNGLLVLAVWTLFSLFLRLKARGRIPDEFLHFSFCWLALTVLLPMMVLDWTTMPLAFLPFTAYMTVLVLLVRRTLKHGAHTAPPRLLLLRVFNLEPIRNRLLDVLDDSWRRIGRIDLVVGVDLAVRTVSAVALEAFLIGQVYRHFLKTRREADQRVATLPDSEAFDGRFPLNELHCLSGVWQHVVTLLARTADVVLLDLRGFREVNRGAAFELSLLVERVSLPRIVVLADRNTDERALTQIVQRTWSHLPDDSPNVGLAEASVEVVRCSGRRAIDSAAILNRVFAASQLTPVYFGGAPDP